MQIPPGLIADYINKFYAMVTTGDKGEVVQTHMDPKGIMVDYQRVKIPSCFQLVSVFDKLFALWLKSTLKRKCKRYVYFPDASMAKKDEFNVFVPNTVQRADPPSSVNPKLVGPVLDHIRDILCDRNPVAYNYMLLWLSHIVKNPGKKTGVCLVIMGGFG